MAPLSISFSSPPSQPENNGVDQPPPTSSDREQLRGIVTHPASTYDLDRGASAYNLSNNRNGQSNLATSSNSSNVAIISNVSNNNRHIHSGNNTNSGNIQSTSHQPSVYDEALGRGSPLSSISSFGENEYQQNVRPRDSGLNSPEESGSASSLQQQHQHLCAPSAGTEFEMQDIQDFMTARSQRIA